MTPEWYGGGIGDTVLHIGPLPGRKQVALYMLKGASMTPLAYFVDETAAKQALEFIGKMLGVKQ